MYSGSAGGQAADFAYTQVFDTSAAPPTIGPNTTLSYWIFPQSSAGLAGVSGNNSSCVALNLVFSYGSALRNSGVLDQNGNRLHPAQQCGSSHVGPVEPRDRQDRHRRGGQDAGQGRPGVRPTQRHGRLSRLRGRHQLGRLSRGWPVSGG